MTICVQYDTVTVVYTLTDRNIFYPYSCGDAVNGGVIGTFSRTIYIEYINVITIYILHLFATTSDKPYGKVIELLQQQTSHSCGITSTCNVMLEKK